MKSFKANLLVVLSVMFMLGASHYGITRNPEFYAENASEDFADAPYSGYVVDCDKNDLGDGRVDISCWGYKETGSSDMEFECSFEFEKAEDKDYYLILDEDCNYQ